MEYKVGDKVMVEKSPSLPHSYEMFECLVGTVVEISRRRKFPFTVEFSLGSGRRRAALDKYEIRVATKTEEILFGGASE